MIASLLMKSRPNKFSRKEPKKYPTNLEILKQNQRQRWSISNDQNQRHEEEKNEEHDEINIDINPSNVFQRDQEANKQKRNILMPDDKIQQKSRFILQVII